MTSANYDWDELFERGTPPEPTPRPSVDHWIDLMVDRLKAQFSPERIVLFGSHARGEGDSDSFIDLLVVMGEVEDRRPHGRSDAGGPRRPAGADRHRRGHASRD